MRRRRGSAQLGAARLGNTTQVVGGEPLGGIAPRPVAIRRRGLPHPPRGVRRNASRCWNE
ncbi:hypothetical protein Ae168Ps1_5582 [Pseudonocardia sp. Ae168_Ps1]|uniref:hypothetical protein n=1 Tax=unclassified Pseudonocardia TaxID=2619320 RepID=UPI00096242EB|nr:MULTISPECIES: hypothetical protein [unclassified Pseudonocardia]OLL71079.1 hypothetical protein Ae168Ps1_5582 [Pseudonocardia sp. Ae168_Ps1]OLL77371.1 hypothetical protein Ae150APs1_5749c [Pseudonocardia sp. Ae150A_Ps1]OLL88517.1 hypothetical protein Ae263Ps1_5572 [Pseudonocardia sp. Ae263_Ps1]OLL91460.1 hypothetical protein Ae356Ps1_1357c [Pseudonocardia sp. Ae356_Ps1]